MDPRIRIVLRMIAENKDALRPSLAAVSKLLGISESRLFRLFKRDIGMGLKQYLLEARMARAAGLLGNCTPSIKTIAFESGYSDVSNFYRDFRKVYAITPKEARNRTLASRSVATNLCQHGEILLVAPSRRPTHG